MRSGGRASRPGAQSATRRWARLLGGVARSTWQGVCGKGCVRHDACCCEKGTRGVSKRITLAKIPQILQKHNKILQKHNKILQE